MLEIKITETADEKNYVLGVMKEAVHENEQHVIGFWDHEKCVGGSGLYSTSQFPAVISLAISHKNQIEKIQLFQKIFRYYLNIHPQIHAIVDIKNHSSCKGAEQLGFRKLYVTDQDTILILTKELWRYHKKWPI